MFRLPTIRVTSVFGIPIEIHASWFAVFLLVAGALGAEVYPSVFPGRPAWVNVSSGVVSALLFFTSLVVHELSHSLVARRFGIRVDRITLFMFGGVAQLAEEPRGPGREFAMAAAGPGMSIVLCLALSGLAGALRAAGASDVWWGPVVYLAAMNLALAVFNLAPGFPMDGGRILRSYLWWATGSKRLATLVASGGGVLLAALMMAAGAWSSVQGDLSGLWIVLVGLFLGWLAVDTYRRQADRLRLTGRAVRSAPLSELPTVAYDARADEASSVSGSQAPLLGVLEGGLLVGVVPLEPALARRLGDAGVSGSIIRDPGLFVDAADSLDTVWARFDAGMPGLVVVSGGRAVGVIGPDAIAAAGSAPVRFRARRP